MAPIRRSALHARGAALSSLLHMGCAATPSAPSAASPPATAPAAPAAYEPAPAAPGDVATRDNAADTSRQEVASPAGFAPLPVPGFGDALVWDPGSARGKQPLWVVAHGAGGNPEWHCEYWRQVVQTNAFLLCLRGKSMRAGGGEYYFPEHFTLGRLLAASVAAFDEHYGERSTKQNNGYIGYSQGATMGALMLPDHAARFSLVLLSEGGYAAWSPRRVRDFARNGGRALFFACGTESCRKGAERSRQWFDAQHVALRLEYASGAGHTPAGAVGEISNAGLAWLVEQAGVASVNAAR